TGADPFSADHVNVIDRIENALARGGAGRLVNAVYRGFAKTTITENATLWAALYGYRKYLAIFNSDLRSAKNLVASITQELCENDLLLADFPEVCIPFRALDGRNQRGASQTHDGQLTHIAITSEAIVLPTIWLDDAKTACTPASGCIIRGRGLTAANRGAKYKRADGANVRPDFALLDDVQTDQSAVNPKQVQKRLDLIRKSVLKSAGHKRAISCVINATVIAHDDVVEQLLDPERNPAWDGVRIKMVRKWADAHETHWLGEYAKIRRGYDRDVPGDQQRATRAATEYYAANRELMDAGCEVSWVHCFDPETEVSAIQHAYNLLIDDPPEVFASECQNEPAQEMAGGLEPLDAALVAKRVSGFRRGEVPHEADHLTAFVDIHDDVLYWLVAGWRLDFTGWVVEYGTWPDQKRSYFTKRQATRTLRRTYRGIGREGAILKGLDECVTHLCGRDWQRADGGGRRIAKLLIDTGWAEDEVLHVCRTSAHAAVLQPSRGVGIRASASPISEYRQTPGRTISRVGQWYMQAGKKQARVVRYDTNHWKTFTHGRLSSETTAPGALLLYGKTGADHRLIADHFVQAETPREASGGGRTIVEWDQIHGRDNHWLDCLVGCLVGASMLGCSLGERRPAGGSRRQRALDAAKRKGLA
ncbi:MAG: terminase gpA endonuclease subunit, partial [Planctomycetaceae bacterium]